HILSDEDKTNMAQVDEDFCIIRHEDQTDYFIRAVLKQKVKDNCQDLDYGIWVSLSEKSFKDYSSKFDSGGNESIYFGYFSNKIPEYGDTLSIKTNVVVTKGNNRPEVIPHDDQMGNDFVSDYYEGISKA